MSETTEVGRIESSDVDEHAEAVAPWNVRMTQLGSGAFRAGIHFVRTERLTVYRERWNQKLSVCGESPPGCVMVGASVPASIRIQWNGQDLDRQRIASALPASDVEFSSPGAADHVVALVRPDLLEQYLGQPGFARDEGRPVCCGPERTATFVLALQSILERYTRRPGLLQQPREVAALESEALGVISTCAGWKPARDEDLPTRREALRCAVSHAETRSGRISVPELARVAGVSQRTLEYAFREGLGMTPVRFLRRRRLNAAHRELRLAAAGSTTVTEVALSMDFGDLGRFALDYRRLFGESPSETLARPRARLRSLAS